MGFEFESLERRALFSILTADFTALGGPLNRPGLGALFGITSDDGGPNLGLLQGSTLTTSLPADRAGVPSTNPFSLANTAPILRKTGVKAIVRYADMLSGFPYQWTNLSSWDSLVAGETTAIKNSFRNVIRAIAPFNEPDNTFAGNFMTDPAIPAGTYDQKVNWLWTHTFRNIRAIDPTLPIMGPNYVSYYPQRNGVDQPRMRAFLQNAIATSTVPDSMAWHQLYGGTAADFGVALNSYYRPLEASLGLPKLPLIVEEYGVNDGKFAGIPSALIPYWAEYERDGVSFAAAGVYDNGGTLGNTVSYFREPNQQPNAGWWVSNWYKNMSGQSVPTSSASTRYTGAFEGIASYNASSRTASVLLGGPDDQASIFLRGVGKLIGGSVRVQLLDVRWTADVTEPNTTLEHGGDPVYAPTILLDKIYTPDATGDLRVNFSIEVLHGYMLRVTPATADTAPRYESEQALTNNVVIYAGSQAAKRSNGSYVGGIDQADSSVSFTVIAPYDGLYSLSIVYGAAASAIHSFTLNGVVQSPQPYPGVGGYLDTAQGTAKRNVTLRAGVNTITLGKLTGFAELDYVTITPTVSLPGSSKYEAEAAERNGGVTYTNGPLASNGGYVGNLAAGESIAFNVTVPITGLYDVNIRYAAGGGAAGQAVSVNGVAQGTVSYAPTSINAAVDLQMMTKLVALQAGTNVIQFGGAVGNVELDFIDVQPSTHRYEAETTLYLNASGSHFPNAYTHSFHNLVVGMNTTDAVVAFQVEAPMAAVYTVQLAYGNGGSNAVDGVSLNGVSVGSISLPRTGGYLSGVGPVAGQNIATLNLSLQAGTNTITFNKLTNFAELNYLKLLYAAASSTSVAALNRSLSGKALVVQQPVAAPLRRVEGVSASAIAASNVRWFLDDVWHTSVPLPGKGG